MSKSSGKPLSLPPLKTPLSTPSLKTLIKKYRTSSDNRSTLRCTEFLESVSIDELYRSNYNKTPYDTERVSGIEILIIPEINVELYCRVLFRNSSYFHRLKRAILIEASVKDDRSRKIIKYLFKSETIKELKFVNDAPIDINVDGDSKIVEIMRSNIIMDEIRIENPNPRSNFEFLRHLNIHYTHVTISDVEDSNRSFCESLRNMKTLRAFFLRIRFKETANFTYLSRRNISEYLSVVRNQNLTSFALTFDFFDYYSPDVLNFFREELSLRSKPLENFRLLVDDLSNSKEELGLGISSIIKLDKIHNIDLNLYSNGQPMIMTPDLREPIIEAMRNCENFHGLKYRQEHNLNLDDGTFPYLRHLSLGILYQRYHPSLMKSIIKRFPSLEKLVIEDFVEDRDDIGLNIQTAYGNIKHLEIMNMKCGKSEAGLSIWSLSKAFVNGFRPNVLKLPRKLFEGIEMPDNNHLFDTNIPSLKPMAERNQQRISKVKKSCLYVIAIFQFRLRNTTAKLPHELIKFITDMMYSQRFEDITVSEPPMIYKTSEPLMLYKTAKNLREILFPTKVETEEQKFNKSQMTARERALGIRPKRFVEDDSSDEDSAFDRDNNNNNIISEIRKEEEKFEKEMEELKFAKN